VKILITGVTGYLGGKLATALTGAGHEVVGTSRNPSRAGAIDGVSHLFAWAPLDDPLPADALAGVDGIVHLVGEPVNGRWTAAKKRLLYDSRVESARNIVRGVEASPQRPSVIVGGSGVGYYGDRGADELPETEAVGSDFLAHLSEDWESAVLDAERLGVRAVVSRTGLVVGRGSPFLTPQLPLFKLGLGGRLGSGEQWWAWVHVDDFTGLIRFALENATVRGPMNVVGPHAARQRDFARLFGRALRRPGLVWAPAIAIRLILGEFAGEVLTSKRAIPEVALSAGYKFAYPDLESALRDAVAKD
jgi:uncharacterized protein (TIGR01777 family)